MDIEKRQLQERVRLHSRRLNFLKERQAAQGLATEPAVLMEIEDIEAELKQLQVDLSAFTSPLQSQHPQAPRVHIHNWGKPPAPFPPEEQARLLNWAGPGLFETQPDKTRRVPTPAVWAAELWPQLRALADLCPEGWVRLEGKCAFSTGFAFGVVFSAKERYKIEVAQYVDSKGVTEYWASTAQPPDQAALPTFTLYPAEHNIAASGGDMVIVVDALSNIPLTQVLEDVGSYFGEAEAFAEIPLNPAAVKAVKGVLVLEAAAAVEQQRPLEGWEAAGLARTSVQLVNKFKTRVKPERLHLFVAAPVSLAVFMGHVWQHIKKELVFYEHTKTGQVYTPTYTVFLD